MPEFVLTGSREEAGAELLRLMAENEVDEFQLPVQTLSGASELIERTAGIFG